MRALRCASQAFRHFSGSYVTVSTSICRQHAALHPSESGHALEIPRFGDINRYIDHENLPGNSIALQASQVGVRPYHKKSSETRKQGKKGRKQGNEGSHKADESFEIRNQPNGIPERSHASDGKHASGGQAAQTTQDNGQESRASKSSEEAPKHEATEARPEPNPEEARYAAEFQRVAGEPCGP